MNSLYRIPGMFLTAWCHVIVIYFMSEHKYSKKRFMLYGLLYVSVFVGLGCYGLEKPGTRGYFVYMVLVVCTFLLSCVVSRDCFSKKCFLFISYFCLFSLFDNGMKLVIQMFLPQLSDPAKYYAAVMLRNVVVLLALALYQRYAVETLHFLGDISSGRWWNLALTAILFYLMQAVVSIVNVMAVIPPKILLLLFAIVSFIVCAVYAVIFSNIRYMKRDAQAALIRQNAEYFSARLSALQNAEETHRRFRHDVRHHLEMIAEYAKAGDTTAILAYIREYSIEVSETTLKQYSLNRTIDSILSVYAGKAGKNGIVFSVKCNAPAELTVRDIDLIALLGNLLENALHGCQKSGKWQPCLGIYIRVQNGRLIIVCDNTCADDLELSQGLPSGKGIGISSILNVCRKYDGNLDYKIEDGTCSACAVLSLRPIMPEK